MIQSWEEKNPGRSIDEIWSLTKQWRRVTVYLMFTACLFLCLLGLHAYLWYSELDKTVGLGLMAAAGIFYFLAFFADLRLLGLETRIDQLTRSVATLKKRGLVPSNEPWQGGLDEIHKYSCARLTENALLLRNAEVNAEKLRKAGLIVELAIATESVLAFKGQFDCAIETAVEFGLSSGLKGFYFAQAEKRR